MTIDPHQQAWELRYAERLPWEAVATRLGVHRTTAVLYAKHWEERDEPKPEPKQPGSPPCIHCGEATHVYTRNDGGIYVATVMCNHCDSHGPLRNGTVVFDVNARAVSDYQRSTEYRDRLVVVCQQLIDAADKYSFLGEVDTVVEMARQVLRDFTLRGERRKP